MLSFLNLQSDPASFPAVSERIRSRFRLYSRGAWNPYGTPDLEKRREELAQLCNTPDLAQVFLFHGDGVIREAALLALSGPIRLPVVAYGLLERLNDWSPEVRSAASLTFERCFEATQAHTLLPAVWTVLSNGTKWSRWQDGYNRLVDDALRHQALTLALLDQLLLNVRGGTGTIFQALARNARFDPYIPKIATSAIQPMLRARALDSISRGKAFWPLGTTRKVWIDKPLGLYKLEPDFASRPLAAEADTLPLLRTATKDRSALVRRMALDGIIAHRGDPRFQPLIDECFSTFALDGRPSIRSRMDYLRTTPKQTV